MPYKIVKKGNKYFVEKQSTGDVIGSHPTREKAIAQLRALYANESKAKVA